MYSRQRRQTSRTAYTTTSLIVCLRDSCFISDRIDQRLPCTCCNHGHLLDRFGRGLVALAGLEVAVAAEQVGLGVVQEDAEAGPALAVVGALEGLEAAWWTQR